MPGLLSRLNLGLDLKGGIHLVLQVVTDDALNQELFQDAERISQELKAKNMPFASSKKGNGFSVEIAGVDSARSNEVRTYLESTYDRKYSLRSTTLEGKTNFSLDLDRQLYARCAGIDRAAGAGDHPEARGRSGCNGTHPADLRKERAGDRGSDHRRAAGNR